jgi:hypothetical protein
MNLHGVAIFWRHAKFFLLLMLLKLFRPAQITSPAFTTQLNQAYEVLSRQGEVNPNPIKTNVNRFSRLFFKRQGIELNPTEDCMGCTHWIARGATSAALRHGVNQRISACGRFVSQFPFLTVNCIPPLGSKISPILSRMQYLGQRNFTVRVNR